MAKTEQQKRLENKKTKKRLEEIFSDDWYVDYFAGHAFKSSKIKDYLSKPIKELCLQEILTEAFDEMTAQSHEEISRSVIPLTIEYLTNSISKWVDIEGDKITFCITEKNSFETFFEEEFEYFNYTDGNNSYEIPTKIMIDLLNSNQDLWKKEPS